MPFVILKTVFKIVQTK